MQISTADIPKIDISLIQRSLRKELDSIYDTLDTHSSQSKLLQQQLQQKATPSMLLQTFTVLAADATLDDSVTSKLIKPSRKKPSSGLAYMKSAQDFGQRMVVLAQAVRYLFNQNAKNNQRFLRLQARQDELPNQISKQINRVEDQIDLAQSNLRALSAQNRKQLEEKLTNAKDKFNELQKNTLWRIKDCQQKLSSRVNQQFVKDAIKQSMIHSSDQASKRSNSIDLNELDRVVRLSRKLQDQLAETNIQFNAKVRNIQDKMTNKLLQKELFLKSMADFKNKVDPAIDQLKNKSIQHKIFIDENTTMIRKLQKLTGQFDEEIRALKGVVKTLRMSQELQKFVATFDIHKICEIDAALLRLKEGSQTHHKDIIELKKLFEKLNSVRMSSQGTKEVKTQSKLSRQQIERVVLQLNFKNKASAKSQLLKQLQLLQDSVRNLEKNLARTVKSLDQKKLTHLINSVDQSCKRQILILTGKINGQEQWIAELKKKLNILLLQEKRDSGGDDYSLIGVKRLYPVENCLGCVKK